MNLEEEEITPELQEMFDYLDECENQALRTCGAVVTYSLKHSMSPDPLAVRFSDDGWISTPHKNNLKKSLPKVATLSIMVT